MSVTSGVEAAGTAAFAELEKLVVAGWDKLTATERLSLGVSTPERFLSLVRSDLRSLRGEPLLQIARAKVAARFKETGLPHLRPGGPSAQREARRLTRRERVIDRRSFDNLDSALSYGRESFTLKQLRALQQRVDGLEGDLRRLHSTRLASASAARLLPAR